MRKCIRPTEKKKQKKYMNKINAKKFLEKINLWKMKIQMLKVNKIRMARKKRRTKIGSMRIIVGIITSLEITQQIRKQKSLLVTLMSTASSSTAISTKIRIRKRKLILT